MLPCSPRRLLLVNVKKWEKGPKFIMDKHKAKQEQK